MKKEKKNESEKEENEGGGHEGKKEGLKNAGCKPQLANQVARIQLRHACSLPAPGLGLLIYTQGSTPYITVNIVLLFCFTLYLFLTRNVLKNTKACDPLGLIRRYPHNSISSLCVCVCMHMQAIAVAKTFFLL